MSRVRSSTKLEIRRGNYLVAELWTEPGTISSALRGAKPRLSDALVSGEIHLLEEEETLAEIISKSASVEELSNLLEIEGYSISR